MNMQLKPACTHPDRDGSAGNALCRTCPERAPDGKRITAPVADAPATTALDAPEINGAEILDEAELFIRRFAALPSTHAYTAAVLWAMHTHVVQVLDVTPRLAVLGTESKCGKTRLMDLLVTLTARPRFAADLTGPTLFTMLATEQPTVFVDESDEFFGKSGKGGSRQVRTIANVGYKMGAQIPRMSKGAVEWHPVFGAMAFAGIGRLSETLQSRCVVIEMRRRRKGEQVEPFIPRFHVPLGQQIGAAMGAWGQSAAADIAGSWPDLPDGIEDRDAEIWSPLLAIADQAGSDWPVRAREACAALVLGNGNDENVQAPGVALLADIAQVWPEGSGHMTAERGEAIQSAELARRLQAIPGSRWADMPTAVAMKEVAEQLRPRGVTPDKVRFPEGPKQGYYRAGLALPTVELATV